MMTKKPNSSFLVLSLLFLLFLVPLFYLTKTSLDNSSSDTNYVVPKQTPFNTTNKNHIFVNNNVDINVTSPFPALDFSSFPRSGVAQIDDLRKKEEGELLRRCDLYEGKWVKDEDGGNYPIYKPGACPFVDEAFDCQRNGRLDSEYLKWRWMPHGCELPRK